MYGRDSRGRPDTSKPVFIFDADGLELDGEVMLLNYAVAKACGVRMQLAAILVSNLNCRNIK